jgi:oxygen-independent coproporphyrinogen III oxidase
MKNLLAKYNRPVPRYTSYPPVPFWQNAPDETEWIAHLKSAYNDEKGIDLYVHVPFCEKLCYYCGCNRTITKNHNVEEDFVELLLCEWDLYCEKLGFIPRVNSLHFGGGTPTFLSALHLEKIIKHLTLFQTADFTASIEIDPRTVKDEHIDMFVRSHISRVSLGIQDFDLEVQKAINRSQSFDLVEEVVRKLREKNISSINFDVIYGLPKQTAQTIIETFHLISKLRPDLIAYYSYAHLPERLSNQRLINVKDLPTMEIKQELYEVGKSLLLAQGYTDIGMDHFSLPDNFLFKSKESHKLHRNFMGYVDKKSPVLLGLGPSAISDSSLSFIQNSKSVGEYGMKIRKNQLAIFTGHTHCKDDLTAQKIIMEIMCQEESSLELVIPYRELVDQDLKEFANDGLITINDKKLKVLPKGKKFIRNIALVFDYHFRKMMPVGKFSQTI